MQITFIGAAHNVTGSCTLLEACGKRILIDCGLEQGPNMFETCEIPVAVTQIDALCLTHAHIDHSGKIPFLVANGFDAPIITTEATKRLCAIMLRDLAHVQEFEAKWRNRRARRAGEEGYKPLYTSQDVERTLNMFDGYAYGDTVRLAEGLTVTFYDAGHLLGSASLLFSITEGNTTRRILFSGDLGNPPRPLIRATATPPQAHYAVIESTYGDRLHGEREDFAAQLAAVIDSTLSRGGNVVIPSFAVGRTQELLYLLRIVKERKMVPTYPDFPVYLDSPLAVDATHIYTTDLEDYLNDEALRLLSAGVNPIGFSRLHLSVTEEQSRAINDDKTPKVIISAAGMCDAGRVRHHLKHNLWRPECTVLFVGYQTEGTLGRKLLDGARYVELFGEEIAVKAQIAQMKGTSCHADRDMLLGWLAAAQPAKVFINHGEGPVCDAFAETVKSRLQVDAVAPYSGDTFDLYDGAYVHKAPVKEVSKKVQAHRRAVAVFEALRLAGKRLMSVIEQNRGGTNKELGRFTNQINALCDKYERKE
jgi:metallo-beta-lactamase family protein